LDKLLPLPAFLRDAESLGDASSWVAGLKLTGHFLERDAFGARHRPLPEARFRLVERIAALTAD
jgi:DNA repair protein RecO (recombination protein O)